MVQIPDNMDEMIDSAMAKNFDFDSWKEAVSGPVVRFHRNFRLQDFDPAWVLDGLESEPGENELVLRNSDYRYAKGGNQISIRLVECESVRIAHEMIFSSLKKVTLPNPPLDRPEGCSFGDVYKLGYWARDNIFVYINDLSEPGLPPSELLAIGRAIDSQLVFIQSSASPAGSDTPRIAAFSIKLRSVPFNMIAAIHVSVTDPNKKEDDLRYTFYANGGRIFLKNGNYYYRADTAGTHKLGLVVTNGKGLSAKTETSIKVVQ